MDRYQALTSEQAKEKIKKKYNVTVDPDNYEFFPEKKRKNYYDNDEILRVAIYVRVSTTNVKQTSSYELQKKYYEDFVIKHPNWILTKIYADEGISGTSLAHRDEFNKMIADCKAGKIDMIITKNVSRFARNIMDCLGITRKLAEMEPPVGVFFESECIFSLDEDSQMTLSFLASMAEEESHAKSRSMEASLRMRLDNGIPLTPKLLGYRHNADGNLIVNPEEAPTVKLIFYMYLYGYSTQQIADALTAVERKTYLGNIKWSSSTIRQVLRNERHCGDVLTRKTFTPNFRTHKSRKNRGERPQSRYSNRHEAIISRADFNAVQRLLDNAKYGNTSLLPELRVIDSGVLKGFVTVHPRWAGFKDIDYYAASRSVYTDEELSSEEIVIYDDIPENVNEGDFDLRGFEITRTEFFDSCHKPSIRLSEKEIKFSAECIRKFDKNNFIELLVNPIERKLAIRATTQNNRCGIICSQLKGGKYYPKNIPASAFGTTLYSIFQWKPENKYKIVGSLIQADDEDFIYMFDVDDTEAFFQSYIVYDKDYANKAIQPLAKSGKRVRAIPQEWTQSFGKYFYRNERDIATLEKQDESEWKLLMEGQLFEMGEKPNITKFDVMKEFIQKELEGIEIQEVSKYE